VELECDLIVLTLPLGVLQARDVSFRPPLPPWKLDAVDRMGNGQFEKVALRFEDAFWPKEPHAMGFNLPMERSASGEWKLSARREEGNDLLRESIWFVNYLPVTGEPLLIAMISGELASIMECMEDSDKIARVLASLGVMYGHDSVKGLTHTAVSHWSLDPLSRGSYSYARHSGVQAEDAELLTRPVAGRILFAGEATSSTRYGYMDGALESGRREAARVSSILSREPGAPKRPPSKAKL